MKYLPVLILMMLVTGTAFAEPTPPYVKIIRLEPIEVDGGFIMKFKICTGDYPLSPKLLLETDEMTTNLTLPFGIPEHACKTTELGIVANDPKSVKLTLLNTIEQQKSAADIPALKTQITDMQKQIDDLKKQIEKKDEIIQEQIKVILELTKKIKTVVLNLLTPT